MKKVVVVGVGALGSHLVQFIRNLDIDLTVIDFDKVETKNVASQFHSKGSVRKGKVQGLKQTMNFVFGTKLSVVPHKLTDQNVYELLSDADLVVDCLDNLEGRSVVQNFCRPQEGEDEIPCLHGALDGAGSFGRIVWSENFVIDPEPQEGAATCEDGQFLPFIAITSSYLARSVQKFVDDGVKVGYTVHPAGAMSH